jgi:hypothetical protein
VYGFVLSNAEIKAIWIEYRDAIRYAGFTRYENPTVSKNLILYIKNKSGMATADVLAWCKTVKDLAVAGTISRSFWDVTEKPAKGTDVGILLRQIAKYGIIAIAVYGIARGALPALLSRKKK